MSEECKYVLTRKGCKALMYRGCVFCKVREGDNGRVFWRCTKAADRNCKVRITTVNEKIESCRNEHNHLSEEEENEVKKQIIIMSCCHLSIIVLSLGCDGRLGDGLKNIDKSVSVVSSRV